MDVNREIDRLTDRRAAIWSGREQELFSGEVAKISKQLADLYEQKRISAVSDQRGRHRTDIVKRARVESELERLMTRGRPATG